jgi:hypothetical protein
VPGHLGHLGQPCVTKATRSSYLRTTRTPAGMISAAVISPRSFGQNSSSNSRTPTLVVDSGISGRLPLPSMSSRSSPSRNRTSRVLKGMPPARPSTTYRPAYFESVSVGMTTRLCSSVGPESACRLESFSLPVFEQVSVRSEHHAHWHCPPPGIRSLVFQRHLKVNSADVAPLKSLRGAKCLCVRMTTEIEPRPLIEPDAIHDERVDFPPAHGIPHDGDAARKLDQYATRKVGHSEGGSFYAVPA